MTGEEKRQKKRAYDHERYLANKDKLLAQTKAYVESVDREERLRKAREYRKTPHAMEVQRLWRQNNPEKLKAKRSRYRDNDRSAQVIRKRTRRALGMIDPTGERRCGPCEVCGTHGDPLHLDHNHTTGVVRGWLCHKCNKALGFAMDSPVLLRKMADYIEKCEAQTNANSTS